MRDDLDDALRKQELAHGITSGDRIDTTDIIATLQAQAARYKAMAEELAEKAGALVDASDQMINDTTPIFAEMDLVRGRPYRGRQIGEELDAMRQALSRFKDMQDKEGG